MIRQNIRLHWEPIYRPSWNSRYRRNCRAFWHFNATIWNIIKANEEYVYMASTCDKRAHTETLKSLSLASSSLCHVILRCLSSSSALIKFYVASACAVVYACALACRAARSSSLLIDQAYVEPQHLSKPDVNAKRNKNSKGITINRREHTR